eukprot:gnl/MRDRNA2_/MRDRNA2_179542_c0_seq1.p1 gnl/MRDRNA2_/MRDRNA2_179542_c0~~gnl/MRDRNA2_/MRDRNA2_179542_c0_seq1.p1  ORF type:complete len:416 (+),score=70.54 gnl/MRDRNA2_/MRDRNA2_179542_c0_seq1:101-1348(+)
MVFTPADAVGCLSVAAVGEILVDLFAGRRSAKSGESPAQRFEESKRVSFSEVVEQHSAREFTSPKASTRKGPFSLFGGYSSEADEEAKATLTSKMQSTFSSFGRTLSAGANDVKQKMQADLSKMKDACSDATCKVKGACSDATSKAKGACTDAKSKVKGACTDATSKVKDTCSDVMERSKSLSSLPRVPDVQSAMRRSWSWSSLPPVPPAPNLPEIPSEMTQPERFFIGDSRQEAKKDPERSIPGSEDDHRDSGASASCYESASSAASRAASCYDAFRQKCPIGRPGCINDPEDSPIRRGSMLFDLDDDEPNCKRVRAAFNVACDAGFGEEVRVVGNVKAIGEWDPSGAIPMKWTEGNVWVAELGLKVPVGEPLEYKYLITADGEVRRWETCANRIVHEPRHGSSICFRDVWGVV